MTPKRTRLGVSLPTIAGTKGRMVALPPQPRILRGRLRLGIAAAALAIVFLLGAVATSPAQAQNFTVLYSFSDAQVATKVPRQV